MVAVITPFNFVALFREVENKRGTVIKIPITLESLYNTIVTVLFCSVRTIQQKSTFQIKLIKAECFDLSFNSDIVISPFHAEMIE